MRTHWYSGAIPERNPRRLLTNMPDGIIPGVGPDNACRNPACLCVPMDRTKKEGHALAWPSQSLNPVRSRSTVLSPIVQLDILLNFSPLIAMLLSLDRLVFRLAEGMFWIANDFCDGVYDFSHSEVAFRRMNSKLEECNGWQERMPFRQRRCFPPCERSW